jgi:hypothetical protein
VAPTGYCLRIRGHLPEEWSQWFEGMTLRCHPDGTTTMSGPVRDQAALHGLLLKVRDLGLSLISVTPASCAEDGSDPGERVI